MLPAVLPLVVTLALPPLPAPDTVRYPVLNHGRSAGEMLVIRDGSSVVVRYIYVDRNRGQRVEAHYRLSVSGDLIASEMRGIGNDGVAGEPTIRYEVAGDSARWTSGAPGGRGATSGGRGPTTTAVKFEPGMFFHF